MVLSTAVASTVTVSAFGETVIMVGFADTERVLRPLTVVIEVSVSVCVRLLHDVMVMVEVVVVRACVVTVTIIVVV